MFSKNTSRGLLDFHPKRRRRTLFGSSVREDAMMSIRKKKVLGMVLGLWRTLLGLTLGGKIWAWERERKVPMQEWR